jgi:VCBS repeat-containing protein
VNDAPTIEVTASTFTEDAAGTTAGAVAGSYVTADQDSTNLTVSFTTGSNAGAYYELGTGAQAGQVLLTAAGAAHVNAGGTLPAIELTVNDGALDGTGSATPAVTLVNDAPTIEVTASTFTEDAAGTTAGAVAGSYVTADQDSTNLTVSFTTGSNAGAYYELGTGAQAGQVLLTAAGAAYVNAGHTLPAIELTVNDGALDGTGSATPVVTLVNDAAVLSSASVQLDETNAPLSTSGQLSISDVDSAETFQAQSGVAGAHGTFSIGTDGKWNYTASSANDSLNVGQSVSDTFTVKSADGTATSVTVTINGTNDLATVSSETKTVTEADAASALNTGGKIDVTDVDSAQTVTFTAGDLVGSYGTFTVAADGTWTYTGNGAHNELTAGQKVSDQVTVSSADGTATGVIKVEITGTNDAPEIHASASPHLVYEAGLDNGSHVGLTTQSVSGIVNVSDVDSAKLVVTATGASHGVVELTSDPTQGAWTWTYTLISNISNDATGINGESGKDSFTLTVSDGNKTSSTVIDVTVVDDVPVVNVTAPGYLQYGENERDKEVEDARDEQRKDRDEDDRHVSDARSKVQEQESSRNEHVKEGAKRVTEAQESLDDAKEHNGNNSAKVREAQAALDRAKDDQAKQHDLDEKNVKSANDELSAALHTQHQHEVDDEKRVQDSGEEHQLNTFSGTLAIMGADALGAHVVWDTPDPISLGDHKTLSYTLSQDGTLLQAHVQGQGEAASSKVAFELTAHADGSYLFTQYQTLDAKVNLSFGFTATDGDNDSVYVGANSANSLQLATQNALIGNHCGDGKESGSSDNDYFKVGVGNHVLEGKEGADVFKWGLSEHDGSKLSVDHIKDFDIKSKGDTLDLRDLLHGSLDSDHLQFGKVGDKLALFVSQDGHLSSSGDGADVKIVLDNRDGSNVESAKVTLAHDLDPGFSGHSISDADLLKKLVDTGHLKTDV